MQRRIAFGMGVALFGLSAAACSGVGVDAGAEGSEEKAVTEQQQLQGQSIDRVINAGERARMRQWLGEHAIPEHKAKKRLRTREGRNVTCVSALDQPVVERLKLSKLEEPPKDDDEVTPRSGKRALPIALQGADGQAEGCAPGSVPIPEVTEEDLARFRSVDDFFRKEPSHLLGLPESVLAPSQQRSLEEPHDGPTSEHQYAVYSRDVSNWGSLGTFNVWKAGTELSNEFSLLQTWVVSGTGAQKQTLEAGWQVYRDLYGDSNPHLFIYSTQDGYLSTGCYNNSCGDFVQRSSTIFPGQGLAPFSTPGSGNQYQTEIRWVKDGDSGAWWLKVEGEYVGYYPRALYNAATGVANHAQAFRFGGEIIDHQNGSLHTTTDMGSGKFPSAGFGAAAYISSLRYNYKVDAAGTVRFREASGMSRYNVSDAACYDAAYTSGDPSAGSFLYLGGPGYHSTNCR